jgi:hypothetical protein
VYCHAVSYVGQEPVLFAGTIADNILYGLDPSLRGQLTSSRKQGSITAAAGEDPNSHQIEEQQHVKHNYEELMNRVYQAAKLANAHDFIQEFPQGYDTDVGSNGTAMRLVTQSLFLTLYYSSVFFAVLFLVPVSYFPFFLLSFLFFWMSLTAFSFLLLLYWSNFFLVLSHFLSSFLCLVVVVRSNV